MCASRCSLLSNYLNKDCRATSRADIEYILELAIEEEESEET